MQGINQATQTRAPNHRSVAVSPVRYTPPGRPLTSTSEHSDLDTRQQRHRSTPPNRRRVVRDSHHRTDATDDDLSLVARESGSVAREASSAARVVARGSHKPVVSSKLGVVKSVSVTSLKQRISALQHQVDMSLYSS